MKFKKMIALALCSLMVMGLMSACDSSSYTESNSSEQLEEGSTGAAEVKTVKAGTLVMATNAYFPPYEYYEGSEIVGIDAEIAQAVADKLGLKLEISDMEFDSIITAVQQGKADMGLAGMTVTEERLKNINFSDTYATGIQSIVVKEDSPIKSVDDLKGKKIGVQLSTTGDIYATDDFGKENSVYSSYT